MATTSRSKKASEIERLFHTAADGLEPRFKATWNKAVNEWAEDPEAVKLMRAFAKGDISADTFSNGLGYRIEEMPKSLREGIRVVVSRGYTLQGGMPGTDPLKTASEWADRYAAQRITGITQATRGAIHTFVTDGIENGMTTQTLARQVRGVLALDPKFAKAALNYRSGLKALETKPGKVDDMVDKYIARAAKSRAATIARTEVMSALGEGQRLALRQAMSGGLLDYDAEVTWITAPGCCDTCAALNGEKQPLSNPLWGGRFPWTPAHPNCRCTIGVV